MTTKENDTDSFWDTMTPETVSYIADVFEVGYTAPDLITFDPEDYS